MQRTVLVLGTTSSLVCLIELLLIHSLVQQILPSSNYKPGMEVGTGVPLSWTKEARIYNGLKTISLTRGAGKSGQPLVKE